MGDCVRRLRGLAWLLPWMAAGALAATPVNPDTLAQDAAQPRVDVRDETWTAWARRLAPDQKFRLEGLRGPDGHPLAPLLLERFEVLAPGARVVLDGSDARKAGFPERTYLRGRVLGHADSHAMLAIGADGMLRGLVHLDGRRLALAQSVHGAPELHELDHEKSGESFACGNEVHALDAPTLDVDARLPVAEPNGGASTSFVARIALETDYEYFEKFASTDDAILYAMDLVAFSSSMYEAEVDTSLAISHLSLWTTSADPWDQSGTSCKLYQFGKHWNDNRTDIERSIAHFLSGTSPNAGIAWVGVLCNGPFDSNIGGACPDLGTIDNFGGAYGVTGGIDGNFDLANPAPVWDIIAFAHEIGHNFRSPHTHCYGGLGGSSDPVDQCHGSESGSGCHAGSTSLPCGTAGAGCGTVMSYCHLLSPGLSNIAFSFGTAHPHGVLPDRVPTRMMQHVLARESAVPGCLTTTATPTLTLAADTTVEEGQVLSVTLSLDRPAVTDLSVDLAVDPALAGALSPLTGHVIAAGTSDLGLELDAVDDAVVTGDRSGSLSIDSIDSLAAVSLGAPASATVTVIDDDAPPPTEVSLTLDTIEVAEGGALPFSIQLDPPASEAITVTLAVDPPLAARVVSGLGPHAIAMGESSFDAALVFDDNLVPQADASATLSIAQVDTVAPHSIAADHAVDITLWDNDVTVSLQVDVGTIYEGRELQAQLQLDHAAGIDVVVDLAIDDAPGDALANLPGHVIPAGDIGLSVLLASADNPIRNDPVSGTLRIASATGNASIGAAIGTPDTAAFGIADDESPIFSDGLEAVP